MFRTFFLVATYLFVKGHTQSVPANPVFSYVIHNGNNNGYDPGWYDEYLEGKNNRTDPSQPQYPTPTVPPEVPNWPNDEDSEYEGNCPRDVIHDTYNGHGYFFSWKDRRSAELRLTWTQALNFCHARCLEPVSIESVKEHKFIAKHIKTGRVKSTWTSGRKCDFSGCEREQHLNPVDIYGWFWEGTRTQLPPTTDRFDTVWSRTGKQGHPQPDNFSGKSGGEQESCLAILNNKYNDGVVWHDEVCSLRKPFVCERQLKEQNYPHIQDDLAALTVEEKSVPAAIL